MTLVIVFVARLNICQILMRFFLNYFHFKITFLGRDAMYSIKWFKDNAELYRYIPTNQPQYKSFQTPGALVDETLSKPNMLMLRITGPLGKGLKSERLRLIYGGMY